MIEVSQGLIDPAEISRSLGRPESELNMVFCNTTIDRSSLILNLSVKLNFVLPLNAEKKLKRKLLAQFTSISDVRISYIYENEEPRINRDKAVQPEKRADEGAVFYTKKRKYNIVPAGNLVFGKEITREPISFDELYETVGSKGDKSIEGYIFSKESKAIKTGSMILTILIHDTVRAVCLKTFLKPEDFEAIDNELNIGDRIRALGHAEYDRYDNSIVFRCNSINKLDPVAKKDEYPGMKRVELHAHTKMSDNDGFNEIDELVKQAAAWGQKAVAITDHGVVQAFPKAMNTCNALKKKGVNIKVLYGMEGYLYDDTGCISKDGRIDYKKHGTYHIILLARNQRGIHDLYKLVSISHIDYFYKRPRLPKSILQEYKDNLVIGSACEAGQIYRSIRNGVPDEELEEIASFYDYLEIQPLGNNQFLVDEGYVRDTDELIEINKKIIALADKKGIPAVATTDSHYPTPEAAIYRNIIMSGMGFSETNSNSLYLRTTGEMLEEFSYLGDRAEEIVIDNTNAVADMIDDDIIPISPDNCPPILGGADEKLRSSCLERARGIYGDPLPAEIEERLNIELDSIISNGYAVMYIAAQMLVEKSMNDGYLVGSRGSVGSSFAATMAGITEVNPLAPHYVCPDCKHFEFTDRPDKYDTGFDMPDKDCPECGAKMKKDGLNIPFATFLGFKGDKEPDIDLNFAGEYQQTAHEYVGEIFGENNEIYKAGTVSGIESKTAFGHVMHYLEETGRTANKYDIEFLTKGCTGVKRTTGQHPGGMIIVPGDREIYDFTPVQRPANKVASNVITTHFEYHSIEKNLLKLDILGHNVPQMIRHLQLMTEVEPLSIPLDDPETLSIFTSLDALNIKNENYRFTHGTYGIPEFGTGSTRAMLDDIKPRTVSTLIKISGFAHGTDVWANNVQDLLKSGKANINEVISSRDDIMNFLISKGVENSKAFSIMEVVRKSKRNLNEEEISIMKEHGIPDWYIWSCDTLKYLFPRAHASAYVMMAIRMAWYKVNYPAEFYAAWLSSKVDDFDMECVGIGISGIEKLMDDISNPANGKTDKQANKLIVYEVVYEMYSRGIDFQKPDLGLSKPSAFTVNEGKVLIPFRGITGLGEQAALSLYEAYEVKVFASIDDLRKRTKLSKTNIDDCKKAGLFTDLPESAQISIFDI